MRPHRTDGISLSFGLIFLLVAVWWAVAQVVDVRLPAAGWLVAGALILFGVIGLLGAIRSGRRTEMPARVQAEARVETPGDLPPEMHADIVRELLDDPADRVDLHPAYLRHPASVPPAGGTAATATAPATASTTAAEQGSASKIAGPDEDEPTVRADGDEPTVRADGDEPTVALDPGAPAAGADRSGRTGAVTRVDLGQGGDPDGPARRG